MSWRSNTNLCVRRSDNGDFFNLQFVFLLFVWRGSSPCSGQCNRSPSTESKTSLAPGPWYHNVIVDLPFRLMRLKEGLQRARCGAIANFHKGATLLIPDGPYGADDTRRLQRIALLRICCKNGRDVLVIGSQGREMTRSFPKAMIGDPILNQTAWQTW